MQIDITKQIEKVIKGDYELTDFNMNNDSGKWQAFATFRPKNLVGEQILVHIKEEEWDAFWTEFNTVGSLYQTMLTKNDIKAELPVDIETTIVNNPVV